MNAIDACRAALLAVLSTSSAPSVAAYVRACRTEAGIGEAFALEALRVFASVYPEACKVLA